MEDKTTKENQDNPNKKISDFEKFKYYVGLAKWFIVSVVIVVMTKIIDSGFQDRAVGMQELKEYDRYVTDKIVLNSNLANRRLLAQYYSTVTPSTTLKEGWKEYYRLLEDEYEKSSIKRDSTIIVNDSLRLVASSTNDEKTKKLIENRMAVNEASIINYSEDLRQELVSPMGSLADDWVIVTGGYGNLVDARKVVIGLKEKKFNALLYKKHNMFRIIIGPYPTQVMAQVDVVSLNNKLNEKNEKNTPYVVRLSKWCQNSQLDKSNNFFECK